MAKREAAMTPRGENTRIKVVAADFCLEIEGSEPFVREFFEAMREHWEEAISDQNANANPVGQTSTPVTVQASTPRASGKKAAKRGSKFTKIKGLDLTSEGGPGPLDRFVAKFAPKSFFEKNLVFVHYLAECGVTDIGANHVYTCYQEVEKKTPNALIQSLRDTAKNNKWLDASDMEAITVTIRGKNHLNDLEAKAAEGK